MKSEPIVRTPVRPRGEKRRASWPLLLGVLAVLVALVVVPFMLLRPRADVYTLRNYSTAVVASGTLTEYVRGSGTLAPRLERALLAPGEGVLTAWLVAPGDEVEADEVIGRLESPELQAALTEKQQDVESAERRLAELGIEHELAEREEARTVEGRRLAHEEAQAALRTVRRLHAVGAASEAELAGAEGAEASARRALADALGDEEAGQARRRLGLAGAEAALSRAEGELAQAEESTARLELRAPIAGQVISLQAAEGERVQSLAVLARVAGSTDLRVNATLGEAQARRAAVGQPATVRVAGEDHPGRVTEISPQAEAGSDGPVVRVVLEFVQPVRQRVGASASVEIEVGRREDALFLPRGPFLTTGGERLVYVVEGDRAVRQTVVFGITDGNQVEVREGLLEGQRIVSSSYEAFRDRGEIRLAPEGEIQ